MNEKTKREIRTSLKRALKNEPHLLRRAQAKAETFGMSFDDYLFNVIEAIRLLKFPKDI